MNESKTNAPTLGFYEWCRQDAQLHEWWCLQARNLAEADPHCHNGDLTIQEVAVVELAEILESFALNLSNQLSCGTSEVDELVIQALDFYVESISFDQAAQRLYKEWDQKKQLEADIPFLALS